MPVATGVARAAAGAGSDTFDRFVRPSALPVFRGSIPYSAGSTTVKRITTATARAIPVAFRIAPAEGASKSAAFCSGIEVPGYLVSDQDEADRHQRGIGCEGVSEETLLCSPETEE